LSDLAFNGIPLANQKTLYRQIASQLLGKRHIPFIATDHEIVIAVTSPGI
jgi:hypothetical protein